MSVRVVRGDGGHVGAGGHVLRHRGAQVDALESWRVQILIHIQHLDNEGGVRGQRWGALVRGSNRQVVQLSGLVVQLATDANGARHLVYHKVGLRLRRGDDLVLTF